MFKTYMKIALRNLYKDKRYALINILGLSLGIACCTVLGFYLFSEFSYDRYHEKHKRIFRVVTETNTNGKVVKTALTQRTLGLVLKRDYPEIEAVVRFTIVMPPNAPGSGFPIYHGKDAFYWKEVFVVEPNIFDVFTHRIIYGDPKTALLDATSAAVSETFAKTVFGDENPIGKTIRTDNSAFKIRLVFADCPENSHLRYDVLFSAKCFPPGYDLSELSKQLWGMIYLPTYYTYLLMPENFKPSDFRRISADFYSRYMEEIGKNINSTMSFMLQPLAGIHLESDLEKDRPTGNKFYVYGFLAVAVFIFLVACINYTNLATARSIKRMRELGMRRILGENRSQLVLQSLMESILFAFMASVIGVSLVKAVFMLTPISGLIGKYHLMDYLQEPVIWVWLLILSLAFGLLAGIYPATYLLSFKTTSALTAVKKSGKSNSRLMQALVILQFIISIGVITCTLVMALQMHYLSRKPLGFNTENKIMIRLRGADLIEKVPAMKNELLKNPRIHAIGHTYTIPGQSPDPIRVEIENNDGVMEQQAMSRMQVDTGFLEMMEIQLASGRYFSKEIQTDSQNAVMVNKTLVKKMGWKHPLGKRIWGSRVIGVTKDFHQQSLHQPIPPLVIFLLWDDRPYNNNFDRIMETRTMMLDVSEEKLAGTIEYIKDVFLKFDPERPFEYEFLDETLDRLYMSEDRLMKLVTLFSAICIFISCLGLYGLSAFTTEQRTKEIGIHKVLGATTMEIILKLSRSILMLILIASVVASVIAYFIMDEWLAGFAYRVNMNLLVFLISAATVLIVAFLTIAFQTYGTAQDNPVNSLRYE